MDMDYKKVYEEWLTNPFFDEATRQELAAIKDDERDQRAFLHGSRIRNSWIARHHWCRNKPYE